MQNWNWVSKKDRGDATVVSTAICNIIGLLIFFLIVNVMTDYASVMDRREETFGICDSYLQEMMRQGYLTEEAEQVLTETLEQSGATNIRFTGTTEESTRYGDRIILSVFFDMEVKSHGFQDLFVPGAQTKQREVHYLRMATSYH